MRRNRQHAGDRVTMWGLQHLRTATTLRERASSSAARQWRIWGHGARPLEKFREIITAPPLRVRRFAMSVSVHGV